MGRSLFMLVVLVVGVGAAGLYADGADREEADVAALVAQLGDSRFKKREAAYDALSKLGEAARDALTRAATSDDPEVSRRASALLERIDREQLVAPFKVAVPELAAASTLVHDMAQFEKPLLVSAARLLAQREQTPEKRDEADKALSQLITDRISAIREYRKTNWLQIAKLPAAARIPNLDATLTAILATMAQAELDLPDQAYQDLRLFCRNLRGRGSPRPVIARSEPRSQAVAAAMKRGWANVRTAAGLRRGLEVMMLYGWEEQSLELARRIAEKVEADKEFFTEEQELSKRNQWLPTNSGAASFLAAHALLVWGEPSDLTLLANLLQLDYKQRTIFRDKYGVRFFETREMALMAAAKITNTTEEKLGMKPERRPVSCPVAGVVRMFESSDTNWSSLIERFRTVPEDDEDGQPASGK